MIKFKQKECSKTTTKVLYQGEKMINSLRGKKKKSPIQLKRLSVKSSKALKDTKEGLMIDPGYYLGEKVIRPTVEAPITGVASKLVPVPGSTAAQITVLAPIEKRLYPKPIREGLEKAGKYLGRKTRVATNAAKNILQTNPGVFFPGM